MHTCVCVCARVCVCVCERVCVCVCVCVCVGGCVGVWVCGCEGVAGMSTLLRIVYRQSQNNDSVLLQQSTGMHPHSRHQLLMAIQVLDIFSNIHAPPLVMSTS